MDGIVNWNGVIMSHKVAALMDSIFGELTKATAEEIALYKKYA